MMKNRTKDSGSRVGNEFRIETDSLGEVKVPFDKLWGAQTQRSLEHFSIGDDLIPIEMIESYAILKKAAAIVNCKGGHLKEAQRDLIVQVCQEILEGKHQDSVPLACVDDRKRDSVQYEYERSDLQSLLPIDWKSAWQ